ncbi:MULTISPECIES: hypothetical protein [unclassified Siphonobacter]|uniref:hypothetical protein n=1 Tax=unclassified Siphonobacter TaxID=2635712 RepID=UPI000CCADCA7|nr:MULTISPECIES: hypothetical protein [unclassified Siphonobacter]MDQ1087970.1 hypothetical protein [Siphonobacter sp. SORGH_AS_1065]MDR6194119.1 hypothetical protein [Siphonobacter sp. SORGH_AS_0500]PKK36928.1 hypothetical protein BWI96_08520 [Siphonobacter sp. SORGH_AS_0500]
MSITLLEYIKIILQKVSFDAKLFEKELRKALRQLVPAQVKELKLWCYSLFGKIYYRILRRCFATVRFRRLKLAQE